MTIQPEGEAIRKATKWISNERFGNASARFDDLIERACIRFDLSPSDAEFLMRLFAEKDEDKNP